ncbi:MAG: hypothetical protein OXH53_06395 [bacterium]|nr:hypothetical protein [bacterium]
MPVTEIERRELVNRLVATIGEESTETLMQCLLTDGRDQLATKDDLKSLATKDDLKAYATKDDLKALENTLRAEMATKDDLNNLRLENKAEFASLRSYIDSTMGKQMRIYVAMLVGVLLTIWGSMVVYAVA